MTFEEATARVAGMILEVKRIRAIRWLNQWPDGHPERPAILPDFVRDHLARSGSSAERT